jgi:hypothetical protein
MEVSQQLRKMIDAGHDNLVLREELQRLLAKGFDRNVIMQELERLRSHFREAQQEDMEDLVLDLMDFLTGWCSPDMKL